MIMVKPVINSRKRIGIELIHLDDGKNLGWYTLPEETKKSVTRKEGPGGYGLFKFAAFMDEVIIISKRKGEPAKRWDSTNPEKEKIIRSFIYPSGRITIGTKWSSVIKLRQDGEEKDVCSSPLGMGSNSFCLNFFDRDKMLGI